ncbi:hypothetical protein [Hymenobacter psoromatis]|uniref:hypothetical protein n=1 Tax=Hymenobacter psoromatis TaxID=1484116 RepID=UPI001CBC2C23|nr:hypothetical protein [Hymenobacter psoromatis]
MIKRLLFAVFLSSSLWAGTARAQTPAKGETLASQQLKQRLRGQYLTNDTAQAIINLYSRRQAGGVEWMIAAMLSAVRLGTASSGTTTTSYGGYNTTTTDGGTNMGGALLVATPFLAYGTAKLLRYSNGHLEQVLAAYAAGQPLPHSLRRKLKRRLFTAPIVPYKHISAQPAPATPAAPTVK